MGRSPKDAKPADQMTALETAALLIKANMTAFVKAPNIINRTMLKESIDLYAGAFIAEYA